MVVKRLKNFIVTDKDRYVKQSMNIESQENKYKIQTAVKGEWYSMTYLGYLVISYIVMASILTLYLGTYEKGNDTEADFDYL